MHSVNIATVEKLILSGATEVGTGVDGIERVYAYQRIGQAAEGPYVAIGVPVNTLFKHSQNDFIKNLALSGLVGISALVVGWLIGSSLIEKMITASRQVDELKRDFVSLVTHQIRTPLTAIKWFTQILQSGSPGQLTRSQKKILQDTSESVGRMINLIGILLTISKLESGKIPLNLESCSIEKLIVDAQAGTKDAYQSKKVRSLINVSSKIPDLVVLDYQLMQQALANLISNAYKYSHSGETIKIAVGMSKGNLAVNVHNRGIGIKKEDYHKLWAKFTRGSNAHIKDTEGAGLGLYLTKLIIEAHGGKIWFTDSLSHGTSFLFTIPVNVG